MLLYRNIDVVNITCELLYVDTICIRSLTIDYYNNLVVFLFYMSGLLHQPQTTALLNEYHNTRSIHNRPVKATIALEI